MKEKGGYGTLLGKIRNDQEWSTIMMYADFGYFNPVSGERNIIFLVYNLQHMSEQPKQPYQRFPHPYMPPYPMMSP